MIRDIDGWNNFIIDLESNILPIYKKHELTFDMYGVHGRRHISRAILFSELMARYYHNLGINVNFNGIRYAVAFHDSGRQGNGIDLWESDSANLCYVYLKNFKLKNPYSVSRFIEKTGDWSINKQIVQDADVLEIMREICGRGGRDGFLPYRLIFLSSQDLFTEANNFRDYLIEDAWKFIQYTENNLYLFNNKDNYLEIMINTLDKTKSNYTVLNKLLE